MSQGDNQKSPRYPVEFEFGDATHSLSISEGDDLLERLTGALTRAKSRPRPCRVLSLNPRQCRLPPLSSTITAVTGLPKRSNHKLWQLGAVERIWPWRMQEVRKSLHPLNCLRRSLPGQAVPPHRCLPIRWRTVVGPQALRANSPLSNPPKAVSSAFWTACGRI